MKENNNKITSKSIKEAIKRIYAIDSDTLFSYPHSKQEALLNDIFLDLVGKATFLETVPIPSEMEQFVEDIGEYYDDNIQESIAYFKETDRMRQQWRLEHPKQAIANISEKEVTNYLLKTHQLQKPETLFYNPKTNEAIISDVHRVFSGHFYDKEEGVLIGELTPNAPENTAAVSYKNYNLEDLESYHQLLHQMRRAVELTAEHYENNKEFLAQTVQDKIDNLQKEKLISQPSVTKYIQETFDIKDASAVFTTIKEQDSKRYFDIINQTFKEFSNHWIDSSGELVTEDPSDPIFRFYVFGYPGYHHLESLEDLTQDMKRAVTLRKENLKHNQRLIGKEADGKEKGNNQELER